MSVEKNSCSVAEVSSQLKILGWKASSGDKLLIAQYSGAIFSDEKYEFSGEFGDIFPGEFFSPSEYSTYYNSGFDFYPDFFPICFDVVGNFLCLDKQGSIHVFDHEFEGPPELVATSLKKFLDGIKQIDEEDLIGGEAELIWKDPNFKPEF